MKAIAILLGISLVFSLPTISEAKKPNPAIDNTVILCSGYLIDVTADPNILPADGESTSSVVATVTTCGGNPVAGHKVRFSISPAGMGSFSGAAPDGTVIDITDCQGKAEASYIAGTSTGTATITATDICVCPHISDSVTITLIKKIEVIPNVIARPSDGKSEKGAINSTRTNRGRETNKGKGKNAGGNVPNTKSVTIIGYGFDFTGITKDDIKFNLSEGVSGTNGVILTKATVDPNGDKIYADLLVTKDAALGLRDIEIGEIASEEKVLTVCEIKLEIKDWTHDGEEKWVSEIKAVGGDIILFRANVTPDLDNLNYAWDWNEEENKDSTDSNKNGIDENDDDAEFINKTAYHCYKIPPYDKGKKSYTVTLNVNTNEEHICTDTGTVYINEALVVDGGEGMPFDCYNWLKGMGHRADLLNANILDVAPEMYCHNIFAFFGHGGYDEQGGFLSFTDGTSVTPEQIEQWRKMNRTPEGTFRNYKYVHLSACLTANDPNLMYAFSSESFLAWQNRVVSGHVDAFDELYWFLLRAGWTTGTATIAAHETVGFPYMAAEIIKYGVAAYPVCVGSIIIKK